MTAAVPYRDFTLPRPPAERCVACGSYVALRLEPPDTFRCSSEALCLRNQAENALDSERLFVTRASSQSTYPEVPQ